MRFFLIIILLDITIFGFAQYPPAAGLPGSTAIFADSSIFVNWAKLCKVNRGLVDISTYTDSIVTNGNEIDATGKADNITVSLGDSGFAVLKFNPPISNGNGFDFAVFENSFDGAFLELAFVEVSSDSIHWFRFPSVSLIQTDSQVTTFGILNPAKINNLAGKYKAMYGTPFDLQEFEGNSFLNTDSVTFIKIIDVIGNITGNHISFDSNGNRINDPFPTPFYTGGFDIDAVGVIHEKTNNVLENAINDINIFPNPIVNEFSIHFSKCCTYEISDIFGNIIRNDTFCDFITVNSGNWNSGLYILKINSVNTSFYYKIIKE